MNALPYLLTASLYLALFYGCYWLLLRRNTFFALNRAYLLASVVLSLLLPLIELPGGAAESLPVGTITLPAFAIGTNTTADDGLTMRQWLWLVYGLGVGAMLVRLGLNLRAVFRLIRQGDIEQYPNYSLVQLPNDATPSFSFGRFLVLNQTDALIRPDALLRHEEAHIRQHHTADILFMELARAAFWFHPVLWLYKRALQEVHEFLADQAVLRTPQPDYARQLVAYALDVPSAALTTPFVSVSTLKQRIVMLQKPQSNRRALLGYALVLPVAALLAMCTQPDQDLAQGSNPIEVNQPARQAGVDDEIFTVVENQPEFPSGLKGLGDFLGQNIKYPAAAEKANIQGRVFISFIVKKTGEIADVKILKGMGFGTDAEAVRVMKLMPRWKPGTQNGHTVNVRYILPINFELEEGGLEAKDQEDLRRDYTTFTVNGKNVSFDEYQKASKLANEGKYGVEGGFDKKTKTASINLYPVSIPPPPPPVPANDAPAVNKVRKFVINGKEVSEKEFNAFPANKIALIESVTTKEMITTTITKK